MRPLVSLRFAETDVVQVRERSKINHVDLGGTGEPLGGEPVGGEPVGDQPRRSSTAPRRVTTERSTAA
jgi:hypothetical protein